MVKNALTDILFNWDKMTNSHKQLRLQDLENMVARVQGRRPRKVVTNPKIEIIKNYIEDYRCPAAFYCRTDEDYIYIIDMDCEVVEIVKNIIHEGNHAYFHDFILGNVNSLKLYSPMNLEMFYIQEENLHAIGNEFDSKKMMKLFDAAYIEERVNHQEGSMRLAKMMLDAVESSGDGLLMYGKVIRALSFAYENEERIKREESLCGVTYDDVVIEALNKSCDEKCEVCKVGHIQQIEDEAFLRFFRKMMQSFKNLDNLRDNLLINDIVRTRLCTEEKEKVQEIYSNYVMKLLREKKKS